MTNLKPALSAWLIGSLLALPVATLQAKDPCVSGPSTGERPGPYSFLVATGPQRGQPTCYICETAEKAGAIVFARSLSDPLAKLVAVFDNAVAARPKGDLRAWLTVLGEKTTSIDSLGKWAKEAGLKQTPTGIFDDPVGPPTYKLAEDADVTVLLFVDKKVTANFAFRAGELDEKGIARIAETLAKHGHKK